MMLLLSQREESVQQPRIVQFNKIWEDWFIVWGLNSEVMNPLLCEIRVYFKIVLEVVHIFLVSCVKASCSLSEKLLCK